MTLMGFFSGVVQIALAIGCVVVADAAYERLRVWRLVRRHQRDQHERKHDAIDKYLERHRDES